MIRAAKAAGLLLAWMALLLALAAGVYALASDGDLLAREMLSHAPPERTGLPEAEYAGVGRMTAAYLTGREPVFQYTFSDAAGDTFLCFQDHEAAHMADCRDLIRLTGTLRWILGGAVLALAGAGVILRRGRKAFAGGMLLGLGTAAAAAALILIWAAADFDGFFTAFHRLAFTNEGWLLNPGTDLLIRLMPTEFFVALGIRLLLWPAAGAATAGLAAGIFLRKKTSTGRRMVNDELC